MLAMIVVDQIDSGSVLAAPAQIPYWIPRDRRKDACVELELEILAGRARPGHLL